LVGVDVDSGVFATCGIVSADGGAGVGSPSVGTGRSAAVDFFLFERGVLAFFFSPPLLLLFFDLPGRVSGTTIDDDLSSLVDALNIESNVCIEKK
jgi:hypothetical protein